MTTVSACSPSFAAAGEGVSVTIPPSRGATQPSGSRVPMPVALAVSAFALVPTGSVTAIDDTVTSSRLPLVSVGVDGVIAGSLRGS